MHIIGKVDKYPPSSIANSPNNPTGRWYERGYGTKTILGKGRKTSENFREKNGIPREIKMVLEVGNTASYAIYVQGRDRQTAFHQARGWLTLEQVAEDEVDYIEEQMQNIVDKKLEGNLMERIAIEYFDVEHNKYTYF